MIEKLLIDSSTEKGFQEQLELGNIPDYAVVFIHDTKKIYAKGIYYPCPYTKEELDNKFTECNNNAQEVIESLFGKPNGIASLNSTGKIPESQLPSYVDDVLEYNNKSSFPETGESGKIYIDKDTNMTYRWSGSTYVEIGQSLALGETSSTAYAGNKGKQNADNISALQSKVSDIDSYTINNKKISTNPILAKGDIGLSNVDNTSDANKPISTATQAALDQKQGTLVSGTNIKTINGQSLLGSGNISIEGGISSISLATSDTIGGIKIGYTESGKNYPVELDSNGKAYVNVPWTDNNTTYSAFKGATSDANGGQGLVPAPAQGDNSSKYLKADGTWTTPPNTTYSTATSSANGLMSSTDKVKLDGIATGATKVTVDSALSDSSTNPVQNKVINSALAGKAASSHTHPLSQISDLHANWDAFLKADPKLINNATNLTDQDLNDYNTVDKCGYYYGSGSNEVLNKPSGVNNFTLLVTRSGGGVVNQFLIAGSNNDIYVRYSPSQESTTMWTSWVEVANKSDLTWSNISSKPSTFTPSSHTHTASEITGLTANRALISDSSGHPTVSAVTNTELSYLDGVTSNIQTQLNSKAANTLASSSSNGLLSQLKTSSGDRYFLDGTGNWVQIIPNVIIVSEVSGSSLKVSSSYFTTCQNSRIFILQLNQATTGLLGMFNIVDSSNSDNSLTLTNYGGTANNCTLNPGCYLCVKTTNNSTYLIGGYYARTDVSNNWTAYQDFTSGAGNSGSDMRFKSEVENVDSTLDDINKINIIKYFWEHPDEKGVKYTFGINADELINLGGIYATMVHHRQDKYNTKWVEYDRFGVLAIKGLQELNKKLEDKCAKYEKIIGILADKLEVNIDEL